jgi:UDP-3-O-[3-hydroxymyristoyl] glucosamine N-acyltransferase
MKYRQIDLNSISEILSVNLIGINVEINSLNLCNRDFIHNKVLTYVAHEKFFQYLNKEEIKAIIISKELYEMFDNDALSEKAFFIVDNPEKIFYDLHNYLCKNTEFYKSNIIAKLGKNVFIHPTAYIEDGVEIGDNVNIGPKVVIHKNIIIGNDVNINSGAIIGTQGFQVLHNGKIPYLVTHVGGVKIGNNVSIGANTTIANSLFEGFTQIGNNTKIDDMVFIAHNCKIGENCILIAGSIMTGSSSLDDNVWLAPNSVILNQINVSKNSFVGASSLVTKNVEEHTKVFGLPAKKIGRVK